MTTTDPFATDTRLCSCGHHDCPCSRCHGDGWIQVQPDYAVRMFPDPTLDRLTQLTAEGQAAAWAHVHMMRAAAKRTIYPCRTCKPALFYRWAGGHFDPRHDTSSCSECIDVRKGRHPTGMARTPTAPAPPPRRDTDD